MTYDPFRLVQGGAPSRYETIVALLDRAADLISEESGMVCCWHEYADEYVLRCQCVQCCVEHARDHLTALSWEAGIR